MTASTEPCASCGEQTAAGSPLFVGRRRIQKPDSSLILLCAGCDERIAAARTGERLTDDEVRRAVDTGSMAGITWGGGGMGAGGLP